MENNKDLIRKMTLKRAKEVIDIEAKEVKSLINKLDDNFNEAVDLMAKCQGRVIVSGMGKTGIVGRKISATLSSTGTPSIWMHSAEAMHGDLGQVTNSDVMVLISNSGETAETVGLLPLLKNIGLKIIALTGNPESTLAKHSDVVLNLGIQKEGCPLGLAPMASTTVTLVIGDALAACLIDRKGFKKEDFALYHPGGSLGRRLLLKVENVMRSGNAFALVNFNTKVKDVLFAITKARCGSACISDDKGRFVGIFTDGDLRRQLEKDGQILEKLVKDVMTKSPSTIQQDKLAVEAFNVLKEKKIDELPVVDKNGNLVGLLDVQDLIKAGLF